jgi:hypothetical protein
VAGDEVSARENAVFGRSVGLWLMIRRLTPEPFEFGDRVVGIEPVRDITFQRL